MLELFTIVSPKDGTSQELTVDVMMINLNHIISMKRVMFIMDNEHVTGYWIRTTNGKKYRAIEIPEQLQAKFNIKKI